MKITTNFRDETKCVQDMTDGEMGIITDWCSDSDAYKGRLVQRNRGNLTAIGMSSGHTWPDIFGTTRVGGWAECRVRALRSGDVITLTF